MLTSILVALFLTLCLFAALKDINTLTIPNWLNMAIAALFVPASISVGMPLDVLGSHVLVALIAFVVCFVLFAMNVFGGGDAKMIPAVVLWLGPPAVFPFMFGTAMIGGVLALIVYFTRKAVPIAALPGVVRTVMQDGAGIPYGVAIAGGVFVAAPQAELLTKFLTNFSGLN